MNADPKDIEDKIMDAIMRILDTHPSEIFSECHLRSLLVNIICRIMQDRRLREGKLTPEIQVQQLEDMLYKLNFFYESIACEYKMPKCKCGKYAIRMISGFDEDCPYYCHACSEKLLPPGFFDEKREK